MNWQTILQAVVQAVVILTVTTIVLFFAKRFKIGFRSDDRIEALKASLDKVELRVGRLEDRADQRRHEQKIMMMALVEMIECYRGKQPNGELSSALNLLKQTIYDLGSVPNAG